VKYLLLEKERTETGVECTEAVILENLGSTPDQTVGVGWVSNETDTGGLQRAESDISEELGGSCGSQVDGSAVVGSSLETDHVDGTLLEELVTSELEGTLEEVTSGSWAETGQKSAGTLLCDDGAETTDETSVVGDWVELDSGLDAVEELPLAIGPGEDHGGSGH
jgi:hypothetical protein